MYVKIRHKFSLKCLDTNVTCQWMNTLTTHSGAVGHLVRGPKDRRELTFLRPWDLSSKWIKTQIVPMLHSQWSHSPDSEFWRKNTSFQYSHERAALHSFQKLWRIFAKQINDQSDSFSLFKIALLINGLFYIFQLNKMEFYEYIKAKFDRNLESSVF